MINMIYGTAWKKENTASLVEEALLSGFKAIDTACQPKHYREDLVGEGLENAIKKGINRKDIFLQTKFTPISGQDRNNMPYEASDNVLIQLEKSFYKSKQNLKTDFIDSYLIHSPFAPLEDLLKVYKTMEEFVTSGEVGQIGISNCYDLNLLAYLYDTAKVKPSVIQNRFYSETQYDKEIREFARQRGIVYQSFWSLTANPHLLKLTEIQTLAKNYKRTVPQIFYKFLNQIGITPLNGTTSKTHMIEDLDIKNFSLEEDEVNSILRYI
ncbi:aldo/keto reductase [Halarcobacter mediterraneus]|uniref:Aldo/keto reductase n=1 Tax=Halarcobacter mediterraneus TaxID=2023153 RepID=A0A4Q1B7E3_9BACT|nr:aldo/keto reductase [Halarcobacter mediterraneus]RXK14519.1 aldo/keto reductase [Halarcobacter mediterraneus]